MKPGKAAYNLAVLTAMSHFQLQTELAQLLCRTQTGKSGNSQVQTGKSGNSQVQILRATDTGVTQASLWTGPVKAGRFFPAESEQPVSSFIQYFLGSQASLQGTPSAVDIRCLNALFCRHPGSLSTSQAVRLCSFFGSDLGKQPLEQQL